MTRLTLVLATALAAAVAASSAGGMSANRLVGSTGPDRLFKIALKQGKTKVTKLKAGKYTIVVYDTAKMHNFHLIGPGVNKKTPVKGKGTFTWKVTLRKGLYRYICDPHKKIMKGSFRVS
jgi:plastocyanin